MVGATGFVGRKLSVALVAAGYDVLALSRRAPEIVGAEGRSIDVADEMALRGALARIVRPALGQPAWRPRDRSDQRRPQDA